jgi:hypothetical protein
MKIIALFCCSALFAASTPTLSPGYNASAQVPLGQKTWDFDVSLDVSFLYYYAAQDGLDIANSAGLVNSGVGGAVAVGTSNSTTLIQDFAYKPGFQVGISADKGEWTTCVDYTWIRQTTQISQSPIAPSISSQTPIWLLNNWFQQTTTVGQTISATQLSSRWHLAMDLVDFLTGRPFYQASNLIISPFGGLRTAWIRQQVSIDISVPSSAVTSLTSAPIYSHNNSNSWGLGPRMGFESRVFLGRGFCLAGQLATALLFTQYTHVRHSEQVASSVASPSVLQAQLVNLNCLRPELELGLGLGWNTSLYNCRYGIDLEANYQFLLFWGQNMLRKLMDQTVTGIGAAPGDLFLQGLNLSAAFRF